MQKVLSEGRDILKIPEIAGLDAKKALIRIPPELDVPLTDRVRDLIDTWEFRRLSRICQLGFVPLVYPGARHTRFEHSLGVYRLSLLVLKRLAHDPEFACLVRPEEAEMLICAALLHDIGHFPCCHLIEDIKIPGLPHHEEVASHYIKDGECAAILRTRWNQDPDDILSLLNKQVPERKIGESDTEYERRRKVFHLLASILSGPVDIDKMDYLFRDSLGAGVPYGKNFDIDRLIGSLCLNRERDGLALTEKGKTAAEMMVFARYVMFSEVYWHHAVRSATVMFQKAFRILAPSKKEKSFVESVLDLSDQAFYEHIRSEGMAGSEDSGKQQAIRLLDGIYGKVRKLYKRVRQFSILEEPRLYHKLAGRPYSELVQIADRMIDLYNEAVPLPEKLESGAILIDAPPVDKEVEFKIDVYYPIGKNYRPLSEVSPVVRALAREQFDDYVKRVRIFSSPDCSSRLKKCDFLNSLLEKILEDEQ
ncbi:MAG: HD domain-containing protein [Planctomycetia bacterium]|nr:HD domain-containing protein [Planctomycetia bacterium]